MWNLFCYFCSSSLPPFVSRKGCVSRLWHFLGIFTYVFEQQLKVYIIYIITVGRQLSSLDKLISFQSYSTCN